VEPEDRSGKIVANESLSLFLYLDQGNSGESNSTWFHDRLTEGFPGRRRPERSRRSVLEIG